MSPKQEICEAPQHRALVIESNDETARYIEHVLLSLGYCSDRAENANEASRIACETDFCFVLLGQELKAEKTSIVALDEVGRDLTKKLSAFLRDKNGNALQTPILAISKRADSVPEVRRIMRVGAYDVLRNPLNTNEPIVSERIDRSLRDTGRTTHRRCLGLRHRRPPAPVAEASAKLVAEARDREDQHSEEPAQLSIDVPKRRVIYRGTEITRLQPQPFGVLTALALRVGEFLTQEQLDVILFRKNLLRDRMGSSTASIKSRILTRFRDALRGTEFIDEINGLIAISNGSLCLQVPSVQVIPSETGS